MFLLIRNLFHASNSIANMAYVDLMILAVTEYLRNSLKDDVLSFLSVANKIFIPGSLEHLFTLFCDSLYQSNGI